MSFAMTDALVRDHMRDVKHQFAQGHGATGQTDPSGRQPRLRSRVGFRLVEAGLHLMADGSHSRG